MRKGQHEGKGVAILVLIIGLFMVLYILFLPPEQRQELLGEDNGTGVSQSGAKTLLLESPGLVSSAKEFKTKHEISSVNVFMKIEPELVPLASKLEVKRSLFKKSFQSLSFSIDDLSDLDKASLSFSATDVKGELQIELNGIKFYEGEVNGAKIIEIPKGLLRSSNKLVFMVDSPGIAFWSTHHYTLSIIALKEEFERINSRERRLFNIGESEKDNMNDAELNYFLYCNSLEGDNSLLKIYLNKNELFSGLIRCAGTSMSTEIDPDDLNSGSNELLFVIDKGDFLLSNIKVETGSKESKTFEYRFSLDSDEFMDVQDDVKNVILKLELDKNNKSKRATIFVNGNEVILNTNTNEFTKDVSSFVEEGDNLIKIVPGIEFNVNILKVSLE